MAKGKGKVTTAMTKTQMLTDSAETTDLSKKQVAAVLDALGGVIGRHVKKGAVGACTIPGLMKIKTVTTPRRPARNLRPRQNRPHRQVLFRTIDSSRVS